jgi:hypothetical protein
MASIGSGKKSKQSLKEHDTQSIVDFAASALAQLDMNLPDQCILDGLVRVDVFRNNAGKLVVNEFESMEAVYTSTRAQSNEHTFTFLTHYWECQIFEALAALSN